MLLPLQDFPILPRASPINIAPIFSLSLSMYLLLHTSILFLFHFRHRCPLQSSLQDPIPLHFLFSLCPSSCLTCKILVQYINPFAGPHKGQSSFYLSLSTCVLSLTRLLMTNQATAHSPCWPHVLSHFEMHLTSHYNFLLGILSSGAMLMLTQALT